MGSDNDLFAEAPAHRVTFRSGFLLGKFPVTQAQWAEVMGNNPSAFPASPHHPVDTVNWEQASEFCLRLARESGHRVRLPSEAEWEYSCRAGTRCDFPFGTWGPFLDDTEIPWEVRRELCEYAWSDLNSQDATHEVGLKRPNDWGLHDMIGNVWEWCSDIWQHGYVDAPTDGRPRLDGSEGRRQRRCLRGGAWDMNAFRCRSSYRSNDHIELGTDRFGLRIAVEPPGE